MTNRDDTLEPIAASSPAGRAQPARRSPTSSPSCGSCAPRSNCPTHRPRRATPRRTPTSSSAASPLPTATAARRRGGIDFYRRGAFVLRRRRRSRPAPQTKAFDDALLRARSQAEGYARALPAAEGRPPFVMVVDVGNVIELYAELTRTGATYTPYPDPRSHRIRLRDLERRRGPRAAACSLARPAVAGSHPCLGTRHACDRRAARHARAVLRGGWSPPEGGRGIPHAAACSPCSPRTSACCPSSPSATCSSASRTIRTPSAGCSRSCGPPWIAATSRRRWRPTSCASTASCSRTWHVLPLTSAQIAPPAPGREGGLEAGRAGDLRHAARARARPRGASLPRCPLHAARLRGAAGAADHRSSRYEPTGRTSRRPRSCSPTRPPRSRQGARSKLEEARGQVRASLHALAHVRVLDPACGSGNFLYVTLEHLKRLEGEVLNQLDALGDTQGRLDLAGRERRPRTSCSA